MNYNQVMSKIYDGKFGEIKLIMGFNSPGDGGLIKGDPTSIFNTYRALRKNKCYKNFCIGIAIPGEVTAMSFRLSIPQLRRMVKEINKRLDEMFDPA